MSQNVGRTTDALPATTRVPQQLRTPAWASCLQLERRPHGVQHSTGRGPNAVAVPFTIAEPMTVHSRSGLPWNARRDRQGALSARKMSSWLGAASFRNPADPDQLYLSPTDFICSIQQAAHGHSTVTDLARLRRARLVVCARRCAPSHRWRDVSAPPNRDPCRALRARGPVGREARARHSTVTLGLWLRPGLTALHIAGAM